MRISVDLASEEDALSAKKALSVDDDEFISTSVDGRSLKAEVTAMTMASARRAADDWIACLMAVMKESAAQAIEDGEAES